MPRILDVKTEGDVGSVSLEAGAVVINFSVTYVVEGDSLEDTNNYILTQTPNLPIVGDVWSGAMCTMRNADPVNSQALLWDVTCEFTSKPDVGSADPEEKDTPIELKSPRYTWNVETWDVDVQYNFLDGQRLANPVGELIEISTPKPIAIFTIERIEKIPFDPAVIWDYVGLINKDPWFGFAPKCVLCSGITSTEEVHSNQDNPTSPFPQVYAKTTYTFKIRSNFSVIPATSGEQIGWDEEVPLIATKYWEQNQTTQEWKMHNFTDNEGNNTTGFITEGICPTFGGLKKPQTPTCYVPQPDYRRVQRYNDTSFQPLLLEPPALQGGGGGGAAGFSGLSAKMRKLIDRFATRSGAKFKP